jgi:hypothetical protein
VTKVLAATAIAAASAKRLNLFMMASPVPLPD